ncbi:MAG: universal stress protein [Chloroflexota bacterium]|nr:universal stress protein [Chloroflexota bacterium]
MYQHILIPLDGSAISEEALLEARRMLDKGARITLVTAVDVPELPVGSFDMYGSLVTSDTESQRQMEEWAKRYLAHTAESLTMEGYVVKTFSEVGEPSKIIATIAAHENADCIVMTTHGRSGVSRWLFGSITNKVLSIAACPVLVVPSKEKLRMLEKSSPEAFYG